MAVMFVPVRSTAADPLWIMVFTALTVWFAGRVLRRSGLLQRSRRGPGAVAGVDGEGVRVPPAAGGGGFRVGEVVIAGGHVEVHVGEDFGVVSDRKSVV